MTIQREDGEFVAECDACGDLLFTEIREFYLVPETLKQAGWNIVKERNGTWVHKCPECVKEEMNPQNDFGV